MEEAKKKELERRMADEKIFEDGLISKDINFHAGKDLCYRAEKELIYKALEGLDQNRTKAARILGISIRTLRNKLNEYERADKSSKLTELPVRAMTKVVQNSGVI